MDISQRPSLLNGLNCILDGMNRQEKDCSKQQILNGAVANIKRDQDYMQEGIYTGLTHCAARARAHAHMLMHAHTRSCMHTHLLMHAHTHAHACTHTQKMNARTHACYQQNFFCTDSQYTDTFESFIRATWVKCLAQGHIDILFTQSGLGFKPATIRLPAQCSESLGYLLTHTHTHRKPTPNQTHTSYTHMFTHINPYLTISWLV